MQDHSKPFRLTIIAAAVALAASAHAQEAQTGAAKATSTEAPMQKVEVRGSAEAYDPRRDDTATKIVVNHEEIVKYGDNNVLDVLKRVPGVTVSGGGGRGGEIRMRGLGSGYTQILINGERAPAGFSIDSLAPDVIERIEVLRAATAEFSTQSIAGTINIVLKKAIKTAQRELKLGYGRGPDYSNPTANLQLSDRAGKLSWSLAANAIHQESARPSPALEQGYDAAGRSVLLRETTSYSATRFDALNISPRLNWNLEGGDTVTWQTFINVNRFRLNGTSDITTVYGAPAQYPHQWLPMTNDNQFFRTDLNWTHKLESGSKLDLKIGGVLGGLGNVTRRLAYNGATQTLDSKIDSKGTDRGFTSTGKYTNPLVENHALALGWDFGYNNRTDARLQRDASIAGQPAYLSDEHYKGRVLRFAGFAQDEWNVTPRWSVYLGMRWEGIFTRIEGNTFDTAHTRSSVWSPLMQTMYKLPGTKADQVRLALTRTYKAPDVQSLIPHRFLSLNNSSTEPDFMGNPDLKPELARGIDAAYEHFWDGGGMASISASTRQITDFTRQLTIFRDGRWVGLPSNFGNARTYGLELETKFPLKSLWAEAPALDLRASVSRNWSTVDSVAAPNNRLDQQTPVSATFGLDYKVGQLTTGASYAFKNGGQVRISANQLAYQSVRRDVDMYALWKFDPKNQLRVALANVLRQDFINSGSYFDQNGSVTRTSITPGRMVVRATMEMKF
ncbi:bifunctional siderophore receptor/adhesin Iha [Massilia terrae]|uniref:TonB-dependent receptor n=1 Tax=Massilia terrae TaxID=1811224 RepID=A0ABT2CWV5_9BURK|nr:TonB-dependent receptor [Massilia terrae]MCS0657680.1 TonB-dependent receptor [Massilia terrae]